jgi:cystathionine gamma-synthase/methionine-gamma-lyase
MPLSREQLDALSLASRGVHAGSHTDSGNAIPTVPPLHLATAFAYPTTDELDEVFEDNSKGYVYSRMANPTIRTLEDAIAAIENTESAVAYASGMAAIHGAITGLLAPGSTILASQDMYGATYALLTGYLSDLGITTVMFDASKPDDVPALVDRHKPAALYLESISNPLMRVCDIRSLATIAHDAGAHLILDNTFASPIVVSGRDLGADVVIYSSTKHLAGHGDSTGGVVATSQEIAERLLTNRKFVGGVLSPFDAWLTLRGIRTLDLRVRRQCENARELASWLQGHPAVKRVHFPGLETTLPENQFTPGLYGTMLAFEIDGASRADAFGFQDALQMIQPATTLGDVQSLVLHPATTSHRPLDVSTRESLGITEGLIRLSAGIESAADIISDLDQALGQTRS